MNPSENASTNYIPTDNNACVETLTSLPTPLFQSECVVHGREILICGGYENQQCYSYHTVRNEYKFICSYPTEVLLRGHCVVKLVNKTKNSDEVTLLSFGGYPRHTLMMEYVSVWDNGDEAGIKDTKHCNKWITANDKKKKPVHIGRDKDNYEGARAVIGGSNNHLLFITYQLNNISVFDLNLFQFVKHKTLPITKDWPRCPLFISKSENKNEMLLFCDKKKLIINYNENCNKLQFCEIPVDVPIIKRCGSVYANDTVLFFGGMGNIVGFKEVALSIVHKYSIKQSQWMSCGHSLPIPLYDCTTVLSDDKKFVHIIGGKDDRKNAMTTHMKTKVESWVEEIEHREMKSENQPEEQSKKDTIETLDLKKHWSKDWINANVEAAKTVEGMIQKKEEDLSFKLEKKRFGKYYVYVIQRNLLIWNDVTIDGNVYVIDCAIPCQGKVGITTQLFVTAGATVDNKIKQSITPIQWNSKMHHDILLQLQDLANEEQQCLRKKLFDNALVYAKNSLRLSIDTFGYDHPFVANAYESMGDICYNKKNYCDSIGYYKKALQIRLDFFGNNHSEAKIAMKKRFTQAIDYFQKELKIRLDIFSNFKIELANTYNYLGSSHHHKGNYVEAIEYYKKALQIRLDIFGVDHNLVADLYNNLGRTYYVKKQYTDAIKCNETALKTRKLVFRNANKCVGDSCYYLGVIFEEMGEKKTACKYFEESWKIFNTVFGEWNKITLKAKKNVKKLLE
ncbi:putative tetratricopeptide TPR2 protein [Reticulomyxa filosa]|uniref:Putative tetratricopeptide TPR2 protein n=1 Tax=Reticulomyxa filosa TaxID=46433 RepID=X6NH05_RETFI|nr:putative tetratricopeptide TPR2 protein [Reticulomyxa filosa]|eukprot:ETO25183.1 putative tetratricopeptide TPR2 protein [Reticulomyxa filosa]